MPLEMGAGLWLLLALAVGILAAREFGRSGIRWFLLALFFTPLAGLLLFILPPRRRACPYCAEMIQPSAVVCRFCGREVPSAEQRGLPAKTRVVLLILIAGVLAMAVSHCHQRLLWWRGEPPIQVRAAG
jgi:predicted nucleic acid-binding Zn ribbon protein